MLVYWRVNLHVSHYMLLGYPTNYCQWKRNVIQRVLNFGQFEEFVELQRKLPMSVCILWRFGFYFIVFCLWGFLRWCVCLIWPNRLESRHTQRTARRITTNQWIVCLGTQPKVNRCNIKHVKPKWPANVDLKTVSFRRFRTFKTTEITGDTPGHRNLQGNWGKTPHSRDTWRRVEIKRFILPYNHDVWFQW